MTILNGDETLYVLGQNPTDVPAAIEFQVTTGDIAALGGGGFVKTQRLVLFGTSDTATTSDGFIGWDSASASGKTQHIPSSTASLQVLIIKDVVGTAGAYPISISGAVDGNTGIIIDSNYNSLTILDTLGGWVRI